MYIGSEGLRDVFFSFFQLSLITSTSSVLGSDEPATAMIIDRSQDPSFSLTRLKEEGGGFRRREKQKGKWISFYMVMSCLCCVPHHLLYDLR